MGRKPRTPEELAKARRIGGNIASARNKNEWTLEQVAAKIGRSKQTVWGWETGRNLPSPTMMVQLAEALGESVSFLTSERLPGKDSMESKLKELGRRLTHRRIEALLRIPEPTLRRDIDALLGQHEDRIAGVRSSAK